MSDFQTVLEAAGFYPQKIIPDGKFYRCKTQDKPKHRNGAYLLDISGRKGVFKNYATDLDWNSWSMDGFVSVAELRQQRDQAMALRVEEIAARKAAIQAAGEYFEALRPIASLHPYIAAKGLSALGLKGLKKDRDLLVIPVMRDGKVVSTQTINADGQKLYRKGCQIKGGVYLLDRPGAGLTCFVEGFATGLAVYQAMQNARVVVCFDAGNLIEVSKHYIGTGLGVVCADNDFKTAKKTGHNKGIEAGQQAAQNMGCGLAYPEGLQGSDWADAIDEFGPDAFRWIARKINMKAKPFMRR